MELYQFLGYLFHDMSPDLWVWFSRTFTASGSMGVVFCKTSFIGELFWPFRIYGNDFQKLFELMGILFRNSPGFMGGTLRLEWHHFHQ